MFLFDLTTTAITIIMLVMTLMPICCPLTTASSYRTPSLNIHYRRPHFWQL